MKKFYCCDYCDELFETEAECKAHEATCSEKKDYDESRKMDKDSLILHLREFIEEVEIFNEAYGADIMEELLNDFYDGELNFSTCEDVRDDKCDCDCDCSCDEGLDEEDFDEDEDFFDDFFGTSHVKDAEERLEEILKDCCDKDKEYTFYLNGKKVSKEDLKKELAKIFSTKVVPAAKDATKTAVKKTDDFLSAILEKLDK